MIHVRMEVAGAQNHAAAAEAPAGEDVRVLVVVTDGRWLALGVQCASLSLRLDVVTQGEEALDCLAARGYALLLLSTCCPPRLQRQIIAAAHTHVGGRIPVIQMVEDDSMAADHACLDAGLQGVLRLPVDAATLGNLLYAWHGAPRRG